MVSQTATAKNCPDLRVGDRALSEVVQQSAEARLLARHGMLSAALFYAFKNEPVMRRVARITRLYLERTELPEYTGTHFYPAPVWRPAWPGDDPDRHGLRVGFSGGFGCDAAACQRLNQSCDTPFDQLLLQRIARDAAVSGTNPQSSRYAHGGMHWVMNFPRLLNEGFSGYRQRVEERKTRAATLREQAFCAAMDDTLAGLSTLARRFAQKLDATPADRRTTRTERLAQAYARVPELPARNLFEALTAIRFMMHFDAGEPGRLDQYLWPFYARDIETGALTPAEAEELLDEHFAAMDQYVTSPGAWHLTLGGSDAQGRPAYNDLTRLCLKMNVRYRQPNTSLRVRSDMPDALWDTVLDNLRTGCGNPALISEEFYQRQLPALAGVTEVDLADYGFGGCTETLVQGKSAVDSIGSTYNLLDIVDASTGTHLLTCDSFATFLDAFKQDVRTTVAQLHAEVNLRQESYGLYLTDPLRSLFADDCLERCLGYHAGGCRYNFEIVSVYGIANAVNSLYTLKKLYAGELGVSRAGMLQALAADFAGHESLRARIQRLDKFGNNSAELNALAREITTLAFAEIGRGRCWRGNGHFLPASIGWTDFISLGKYLGATPDGRRLGEPLADSTGPTQGTDRLGPTETLLSSACVAQHQAPGTCVLNLLLDPGAFATAEQRRKLKALFTTYFTQGGSQLQVNVVDAAVLRDAFAHPEKHAGLFVRVAGYNDYYTKQSREIQAEILERSQHRV